MSELIPYLGVGMLCIIAAAAFAFLAKRGLWIRRFKHRDTEVEFDAIRTAWAEVETSVRPPSSEEIELTQELLRDCELLGLPPKDVRDFILREAERHPVLFLSEFSSLPFIYFDYVLLLTWDQRRLKAERLLQREDAYPVNDFWSRCLAFYRKATMLPYRRSGSPGLITSSDAKRAFAVYRRLCEAAADFLTSLEQHTSSRLSAYNELPSLLEEVEDALQRDDAGVAIARMELLLSTIHKLIVRHAPQGTGRQYSEAEIEIPELCGSTSGKGKVLVVDDDSLFAETLCEHLSREGYDVLATTDPRTAMRTLVDNTFDVVITDIRMSFGDGGLDGREVMMAAKRANPSAKVIMLTAYFQTTLMAHPGCDLVLDKGSLQWDRLPDQIEQVRQRSTPISISGQEE